MTRELTEADLTPEQMRQLHWELQKASIDRLQAAGQIKIITVPRKGQTVAEQTEHTEQEYEQIRRELRQVAERVGGYLAYRLPIMEVVRDPELDHTTGDRSCDIYLTRRDLHLICYALEQQCPGLLTTPQADAEVLREEARQLGRAAELPELGAWVHLADLLLAAHSVSYSQEIANCLLRHWVKTHAHELTRSRLQDIYPYIEALCTLQAFTESCTLEELEQVRSSYRPPNPPSGVFG